ncbi:MAG: hypothetical protein IPF92_17660 [Myxococcales bacterium]|nr:hypothetical protein [Myxococcales bacterium]MBL0196078.1 hypothetical protein [Myxococcales bacterium]HQY64177.1 hypothetical protein [Polyangiaceae bacterium]
MQKRAHRGLGWVATIAMTAALAAPAFAQAPATQERKPTKPSGAAPTQPGAPSEPVAPPAGGAAAEPPPPQPKAARSAAGYGYSDPPARKGARAARPRAVNKTGPIASFPGFSASEGGGSRLSVRLTASVAVEEHAAAGSVTYVLKGARISHWNDTNALVTVHFNTPMVVARLVPKGADLHLIVVLRAPSTPTHKLTPGTGGTFTFEVDFPKGEFLPLEAGAAPAKATPATPTPQPVEPPRTPEPKP